MIFKIDIISFLYYKYDMDIQAKIKDSTIEILNTVYDKQLLSLDEKDKNTLLNFTIEIPPNLSFGHFALNIAMVAAKVFKQNPRVIATDFKQNLLNLPFIQEYISHIEIAGAGFLNLFLAQKSFQSLLSNNFTIESLFTPTGNKIIFEFVSANPTGPLNIVSARAAATGDSICRVLKRTGSIVHKEYYINDYGNQVNMLGYSVAFRYLEKFNSIININLPIEEYVGENAYQGEYIKDVVQYIVDHNLLTPQDKQNLCFDSQPTPFSTNNVVSVEWQIWIGKPNSTPSVKGWLQKAGVIFTPLAVKILVDSQKKDLSRFNVEFDQFFSEKTLHEDGSVEATFTALKQADVIYQNENASFFKSTLYNDDKDRVVKRSNGQATYLLADIAYHRNKFTRGYNTVYNIWGPDHHGYIARLAGSMQALGYVKPSNKNLFKILIIQQVNLIENGTLVVMSKRLGKFQTMKELMDTIPLDVARYFFTARSPNQSLDFDLELALDQSSKNPVYYIQYAHARIYSIFREAKLDMTTPLNIDIDSISKEQLFKAEREALLLHLLQYPNELEKTAHTLEIHRINIYVHTLASCFTKFYHHNENRILPTLANNKQEGILLLQICRITAFIIKDALNMLGISAPTSM